MQRSSKSDSNGRSEGQVAKWVGIGIAVLFVGSILWSIIFETMLPLWRAGEWLSIVYHLVGIPIILAGTGCFVYGGFVFVRDTFGAMGDESMIENRALIHRKPSKEAVRHAQRENLKALLRAWWPGTKWLAAGFGLIAVGGFLINL